LSTQLVKPNAAKPEWIRAGCRVPNDWRAAAYLFDKRVNVSMCP